MPEPAHPTDRSGALPAPTRLAEAILRGLHGDDADALVGDLAEAYQRRRREHGAVRAWGWGWWQVVASAAHGSPSAGRSDTVRPVLGARMALRALRRDPATSMLAAGILALGFSAPTIFASLLWGAARPLPVAEGERVVRVDVVQPERDGRALSVTGRDLEAWAGASALSGLGGFAVRGGTLQHARVAATRVSYAALTGEVLPLLGVGPALGRLPDGSGADDAVLIGHETWQELFDGSPDVLGAEVTLGARARTVVGVMPEGFAFPYGEQAWLVLAPGDADTTAMEPIARLAHGASNDAAAAQLQARWSGSDAMREADDVGGVVLVRGFTAGRGEGGEAVAFLGLVLVGVCLLVIACANVANLLLVRATQRVRSLGIQAALGAGAPQLGLQLLLEALVLAMAGGLGGLGLAHLAVGWVQEHGQANFGYYWMRMGLDGPVLPAVAGLVLVAALMAGALPALRIMRADLRAVLSGSAEGDRQAGPGGWSRAFVTTQLTLSCAALAAAGIAGSSVFDAGRWGSALPADEVLTARLHLSDGGDADLAIERIEAALSAEPGVRHAALAVGGPGAWEPWGRLEVDGETYDRPADRPVTWGNAVTPGFFAVHDLGLLQGRLIEHGDRAGATPVAVVSDAFARRFLGEGDPLGRRLRVPRLDSAWATVVGVFEAFDLGAGPAERVYFSLAQVETPAPMAFLRGGSDAEALAPSLRSALAAVDPSIAVNDVQTLADVHRYMVRAPSMLAALAVGGGLAGLLVAAVGLYGVLAVRVRQRRRELGVRLALGADGRRLARDVLWWALAPVLPALAVGLGGAWLASPILGAILLGGDPRDPGVYAAVGVAFLSVGLLAAVVPAARAAATEPSRVLRAE